jgi:glycosyltransferase involved in cell wall biosynthesis
VNIDELRMQATSDYVRPATDRIRLFYAGRLYYRKGILQLMRILDHLAEEREGRDFSLNVFGQGPLERTLKNYVASHLSKKDITMRGHVDRVTLLRELSASDIVCVPSLYEACPVLMIEAMAFGKPIVAFDLPFAREILGDAEELLASGLNDFREKLVHLIYSQDERANLKRKMLDRSKEFDAQKIAAEYEKVYKELS